MSRVGTAVTAILDPELLSQLDALCAASGMSRAEQIRAMIECDYAEWRALTAGRTTAAGAPSREVACPQCRQIGCHKMDCSNKST